MKVPWPTDRPWPADRLEDAEQYALWIAANDNNNDALIDLERIKKLVADGDVGWSGNCDDGCGWDGKSDRCRCGNRRVCWHWDGSMFVAQEY